jgi:hypothetical protein
VLEAFVASFIIFKLSGRNWHDCIREGFFYASSGLLWSRIQERPHRPESGFESQAQLHNT